MKIFRYEHTTELEKLNEILLKAMAMSLNLKENWFLDMFGGKKNAAVVARFNFYLSSIRVVTNSERGRMSLAVFRNPNPD